VKLANIAQNIHIFLLASEVSETLSVVYKFEKLYMRIYIWTYVKHNTRTFDDLLTGF